MKPSQVNKVGTGTFDFQCIEIAKSFAKSKHSASFCESLESGIAEMIGKLRILGISTFANFLDSMHSCNFRMDFEIGKLETELKR